MDLSTYSYEDLLKLRYDVNTAIEAIESESFNALKNGVDIPGFKLTAGRKTRSIINEQDWVKALTDVSVPKDVIYSTKLAGIPAIEKYFKTYNLDPEILDPFIAVTIGNQSMKYVGF